MRRRPRRRGRGRREARGGRLACRGPGVVTAYDATATTTRMVVLVWLLKGLAQGEATAVANGGSRKGLSHARLLATRLLQRAHGGYVCGVGAFGG